jgi:nitrogenase iron protein NifH
MKKKNTRRIALYGKGGIGKSTIATNLSAAFSKLGLSVLHIGCDPKGDSTRNLTGKKIKTVMSLINEKGMELGKHDILNNGFGGVACIEAGGPKAGTGCAGMGITTMADELNVLGVYEQQWDVILYDVLGDVVCGGFAVPMRKRYVDYVYIVSSSEFMSIYAANNILKSVNNYSDEIHNMFGGIIYNQRTDSSKNNAIKEYSKRVNSRILANINYSQEVVLAELMGKTVIEAFPESEESKTFIDLALSIIKHLGNKCAKAIDDDELESLREYILDLELKNGCE